ncbi:hypothetical protein [Streptomyces sp. NPDC059371]|uniref:hypothetical protein n=1 Tax=Streptomyces sp. NPDC059371 TaxID=3346812 RepID=UPI0036C00DB4
MIIGYDDNLVGGATTIINRLRGPLTQIHPSLEQVLGPRVQHPAVLKPVDQSGSPAQIRKGGRRQLRGRAPGCPPGPFPVRAVSRTL